MYYTLINVCNIIDIFRTEPSFFSEIDSIAPRTELDGTVTTTIQECMDDFKSFYNVFTLTATNNLAGVAKPLLRGGRLDLIIDLKLPGENKHFELF